MERDRNCSARRRKANGRDHVKLSACRGPKERFRNVPPADEGPMEESNRVKL